MYGRLLTPLSTQSYFLFGARGVGKSTFLKQWIPAATKFDIDLLSPQFYDRYQADPALFKADVLRQKSAGFLEWVVIDEVQKMPQLLDAVHQMIFEGIAKFVLTGSSARKLRRGQANLLAGRALLEYLYPLTHRELDHKFSLERALSFGTLPRIWDLPSDIERAAALESYVQTYLTEEVFAEQIVRGLQPFRKFLRVAAQTNGTVLNYSKLGREAGMNPETVKGYFQILEDTLVGFFLEPYHTSARKRITHAPKFYLFDIGVQRAMSGDTLAEVHAGTYNFGRIFEHFVILECIRLNQYYRKRHTFSFLRTKDDAEIDLVIERPGEPTALVEIKSATLVDEERVRRFARLAKDIPNGKAFVLSREALPRMVEGVEVMPWREGLRALGYG